MIIKQVILLILVIICSSEVRLRNHYEQQYVDNVRQQQYEQVQRQQYKQDSINSINNEQQYSHLQIPLYAGIITQQNHLPPSQQAKQFQNSSPKISPVLIITLIILTLFIISCFFCCKCLLNEKQQSQQNIPCYKFFKCCSCIIKPLKYLLCIDCILRCLGIKQYKKQKEERIRKEKQQQQKKKGNYLYNNNMNIIINNNNGMIKQPELNQLNNNNIINNNNNKLLWHKKQQLNKKIQLKSLKCCICNKPYPDTLVPCLTSCTFHLSCFICNKNSSSSFTSNNNKCPSCHSAFSQNILFFCRKCNNKFTSIGIQNNNVYYQVELSEREILQSIGNKQGKCDQCIKKKGWFF